MCLNSAKTGDTVTVTLKSSNIFVPNIPHTISPKTSQLGFDTIMAFILQWWFLHDWRQAPVV